jgi:hypothetical protein
VGSGKEFVDKEYIAKLLAGDWGFYYTVAVNLGKIAEAVKQIPEIQKSDKDKVLENIKILTAQIESQPKSLGWRARARVGTKRKWYHDVSTPNLPY